MRIIYYSDAIIPSHKANCVHIMKMCQAFADLGHRVELIAPVVHTDCKDDPYEYYGVKNNFKIVRFPVPRFKGGGAVYGLCATRYIRDAVPKLTYGRSKLIAFYLSLLNRTDFALELHQPTSGGTGSIYLKRTLKSSHFKKVVVISNTLRDYYHTKWKIPLEQIVVAHDGADAVDVMPQPASLKNSRSGQINAGYIGSLHTGKGMEMIAELAPLFPEVDFHVVGGDESDINSWGEKTRGMSNIIYYGHVPHSVTLSYCAAFNLTLAPYMNNVFGAGKGRGSDSNLAQWMSPLKIFEYMSMGKVIVTSDLPSIREIITDGENGFLCRPGDISAWEKKLRSCISDLRGLEAVGLHAKAKFEAEYTWRKRAERILSQIMR